MVGNVNGIMPRVNEPIQAFGGLTGQTRTQARVAQPLADQRFLASVTAFRGKNASEGLESSALAVASANHNLGLSGLANADGGLGDQAIRIGQEERGRRLFTSA